MNVLQSSASVPGIRNSSCGKLDIRHTKTLALFGILLGARLKRSLQFSFARQHAYNRPTIPFVSHSQTASLSDTRNTYRPWRCSIFRPSSPAKEIDSLFMNTCALVGLGFPGEGIQLSVPRIHGTQSRDAFTGIARLCQRQGGIFRREWNEEGCGSAVSG